MVSAVKIRASTLSQHRVRTSGAFLEVQGAQDGAVLAVAALRVAVMLSSRCQGCGSCSRGLRASGFQDSVA